MRKTEADILCEAVDEFAAAMKAKLLAKALNGWHGWRGKKFHESGRCLEQLVDHAALINEWGLPEEVDVANFCMFRWWYLRKVAAKGSTPKGPTARAHIKTTSVDLPPALKGEKE